VLYYADPLEAERVESHAEHLLAVGFGMSPAPAADGVEGGRQWVADTYRGTSFRRGGYVVFVGGSLMDEAASTALAKAADRRLREMVVEEGGRWSRSTVRPAGGTPVAP
jgi:predicted butyrate kinase (DUF1464 family)